jgi:1,2-diacylglycerol 3-beta-galactosyltransferase
MELEQKRILILTADAGFGHRSAANAIARALQEKHPQDCAVEIVNPLEDRRTPALLRDSQADYDRMVREIPRLLKIGFEASDNTVPIALAESAFTVMLYEVMHDILHRYQPDAIILTYPMYQAPLVALFTIQRKAIPTLTTVTDLGNVHGAWFNTRIDQYVVGWNKGRDQAVAAGIKASRIHITGIPVNPDLGRPKGSPAELRAELGWQTGRTTFLAVGSRRVGNLPEIVHVLNHSGFPIQLALVAGGDDELFQEFKAMQWHIPVTVYGYVNNLPQMMHAADAVISKAGGLIVAESLACGLPLLMVNVIPGQETGNAEYVVENGAGDVAKDGLSALEVVSHWLGNGGALLAERRENARRSGKPDAAYATAEIAWREAQHGPRLNQRRKYPGQQRMRQLLNRFQVPIKDKD